jgi:hypothetical protein
MRLKPSMRSQRDMVVRSCGLWIRRARHGYQKLTQILYLGFFGLATEPSRSPDTEFTEEKTNWFSSLCTLCRSSVFSVAKNSSIKFAKELRNCECYCILDCIYSIISCRSWLVLTVGFRIRESPNKKALATGVTKALKKRRQRRLLRDDESRALRGTRELTERRVV